MLHAARRTGLAILTIIALIGSTEVAEGQVVDWKPIFRDGQPLPGDPDPNYFTHRSLTSRGGNIAIGIAHPTQQAFLFRNSDFMIWPGPISPIAIDGAEIYPGGPRYILSDDEALISSTRLNGSGQFAMSVWASRQESYAWFVTGTPGNAILATDASGQVVKERITNAPQVSYTFAIGDGGDLAIRDPKGMWVGRPDALRRIAVEGTPAVGTNWGFTANNEYSWRGREPKVNATGKVAFWAMAWSPDGNYGNTGIWVGSADGVERNVAASGGPAVGANGYVFLQIETPEAFTNTGNVLFQAEYGTIVGFNRYLAGSAEYFASPDGFLQRVAEPGRPAPGTGGATFAGGSTSVLEPDDHMVSRAVLAGAGVTGDNDVAVFTGLPGSERLLARTGDPVPGAPSLHFVDLYPMHVNARGDVLLLGTVGGEGTDASNDRGYWLWDASGAGHLLFREGTPLDLGGGRTAIPFIDGAVVPDPLGFIVGLTDAGEFSYWFRVDGIGTLYLGSVAVPEPALGSTVLSALWMSLARRRRAVMYAPLKPAA